MVADVGGIRRGAMRCAPTGVTQNPCGQPVAAEFLNLE
jgi:hypothetical protein